MKKIFALVCTLVLALSLTACNNTDDGVTSEVSSMGDAISSGVSSVQDAVSSGISSMTSAVESTME